MKNIFGLTLEELQESLKSFGVPSYRARQVAEWMYQKGARSFDDMTNLPKNLRATLPETLAIGRPREKDRLDSADGRTTKFLLEFDDGTAVETVLMRQPYGNSICVSTQAGCNMGCAFCASTLHGMARNLSAGEIFSQAIIIEEMLHREGQGKIDTVVIMGYRNITLSTSGIVPNMYRLAEEGLPISLSVSLHAPNDALRSRLMPINRKYPLADVVKAARHYAETTKRRVTYEYILIDQLNDGEEQAQELVSLLRGQLASVNLIPINPVVERHLLRPSAARIKWFEQYLLDHHIQVTVRREMGTDIQAACGQLRNKHLKD